MWPAQNIQVGFELPMSDVGIEDELDNEPDRFELVNETRRVTRLIQGIDRGLARACNAATSDFAGWLHGDGGFRVHSESLIVEKSD
jgi:hypothetical protein